MSLIYKNHLVFPTFKHSETVTNYKSSSIRPNIGSQSVTPIRQGNPSKIRPLNITALPGNETTINGESIVLSKKFNKNQLKNLTTKSITYFICPELQLFMDFQLILTKVYQLSSIIKFNILNYNHQANQIVCLLRIKMSFQVQNQQCIEKICEDYYQFSIHLLLNGKDLNSYHNSQHNSYQEQIKVNKPSNYSAQFNTITPRQKHLPILTPRIQRSDEQNLHDYLDHLNSIRKSKQPTKQAVMKKIRTETEIMKLESQTLIQKFKKVKEQQDQRKNFSLLQTIKNPYAQQYINFSKQIFNLIHNLHQLKEYLNNSRKMFQVVKNLIGMKKNLKKILLKQSADELLDFQDIAKMCCIREIQYVNGEQRMIDKFDLTLLDDLTYMTEAIESLLLQNKLNAIKRISDNIQIEEYEISKLREQLGIREEDQKLSVSTLAMQRFKPHLELDNIEQRLGLLSQIPKQYRQTSQVVCEIVDKLNE